MIFSAHGVPKSVPEAARARNLFHLDATCPLVTKVHREAEILHRKGREIVLIGHAGHPEVVGTMGQLPPGAVSLVETEADAEAFAPQDPDRLAWITQTTLSVDDTAAIVAMLTRALPEHRRPAQGRHLLRHDQPPGRREARRRRSRRHDRRRRAELLQLAAPSRGGGTRRLPASRCSSSARPRSTGRRFANIARLGVTAGASAPEVLIDEVIDAFSERFEVSVEVVTTTDESIAFNLPRELREAAE